MTLFMWFTKNHKRWIFGRLSLLLLFNDQFISTLVVCDPWWSLPSHPHPAPDFSMENSWYERWTHCSSKHVVWSRCALSGYAVSTCAWWALILFLTFFFFFFSMISSIIWETGTSLVYKVNSRTVCEVSYFFYDLLVHGFPFFTFFFYRYSFTRNPSLQRVIRDVSSLLLWLGGDGPVCHLKDFDMN